MRRSASRSRGLSSSLVRRSNRSVTRLRSSGVMGSSCRASVYVGIGVGGGMTGSTNICWPAVLRQRDAVTRKQARKGILNKERVFLLPQGGELIELL